MEGRQTGGWVLALAGSLVLHAAIIGFVAAPSMFSKGGGEGDGEPVQETPVAPDAAPDKETPSKPSPPARAEPSKPAQPAQSKPARAAPSKPAPPARTEPSKPAQASPKSNPQAPQPDAPATGDETQRPDFHIVRQGDTITKIAKDYGMTPEEIARINGKPLKRLNNIWVGQKIKLK